MSGIYSFDDLRTISYQARLPSPLTSSEIGDTASLVSGPFLVTSVAWLESKPRTLERSYLPLSAIKPLPGFAEGLDSPPVLQVLQTSSFGRRWMSSHLNIKSNLSNYTKLLF